MADVISTIGAAGDYATIEAWNADLGGAAGGVGNHAIGELIDASINVGNITINNTTPDAVTLRAAAGNQHDGIQAGSGATVLQTSLFQAFKISRNNVTLADFRFQSGPIGTSGGNGVQVQSGSGFVCKRMLFEVNGSPITSTNPIGLQILSAALNPEVHNSAFIGFDTTVGGFGLIIDSTTAQAYYNTAAGCDIGIQVTSAGTYKNNIAVGNNTADWDGLAGATIDTNIDSDGTLSLLGATNSYTKASTILADLTVGAINPHLSGPDETVKLGLDLSASGVADINIDIDRQIRSSPWYMGADTILDPAVLAFRRDEGIEFSSIPDQSNTGIRISGSSQNNLAVSELFKLWVTWKQTAKPLITDPIGFYSVQTGADRGLYYNNSTKIALVAAYPNDGAWPV